MPRLRFMLENSFVRSRALKRQRRDWEELAGFNPEWAVLAEPDTKLASWDMDKFFATGAAPIEKTMRVGAEFGLPRKNQSVLDFGCGVGRLSRALSDHFESYVGVDISAGMITRAEELGTDVPDCSFLVNDSPDLRRFEEGEFDAVVSYLVLQHIPDRALIRAYLVEFARVLAPGGLISVQLPSKIPLIYRLVWRRRLYRLVRALGVSVERAHRLGLHNVSMQALPEIDVREALEEGGCEVVRVENEQGMHGDVPLQGSVSSEYYATKR